MTDLRFADDVVLLMMMTAHRSASDPNDPRKRNDKLFIHKSVSEIDAGLTASAFNFLLLFRSPSILSSLLRLLLSACFTAFLFFLPSSFSVCFLKSSFFLFFFQTLSASSLNSSSFFFDAFVFHASHVSPFLL